MLKAIRSFFRMLGILIAVVLVLCVFVLGAALYLNSAPAISPDTADPGVSAGVVKNGELFFEVRSGETAFSIGKRLKEAGVIRNHYFWYLLFRFGSDYIKTGYYKIELPLSQIQIRSILTKGDQLLFKVTIPEGVTLKKAARIFEDEGICKTEEFLVAASSREVLDAYAVPGPTMEGYLFPDTYLFPLGYPAVKVVRAMADNFFLRLYSIAGESSSSLGASELNTLVIIASIVEREYRIPEEAALMAGVFFNRLKIGMALQSCATVEYVITDIQGRPHPEVLYTRDLEIRDPYNTYLQPGLPPGPISAPGETALEAAFFPRASDFLYFRLNDPSAGRHYFSRTLDDHIRAGILYLKDY